MNQTLQAQVPIASMDVYRLQHRLDQSQSHLSSAKRSRNRGVFLSHQGLQKLIQANVLYNEFGERYTYEQLSERSRLDERTVSRLLFCEVKVDKNTLRTFFYAFNLLLEAGDYTSSKSDGASNIAPDTSIHTASTTQRVEFEQLVEELTQLKHRLKEYDRLFHQLGLNESYVSQPCLAFYS